MHVLQHKQNWVKPLPHCALNVKGFQTRWASGHAGTSCPNLIEVAAAPDKQMHKQQTPHSWTQPPEQHLIGTHKNTNSTYINIDNIDPGSVNGNTALLISLTHTHIQSFAQYLALVALLVQVWPSDSNHCSCWSPNEQASLAASPVVATQDFCPTCHLVWLEVCKWLHA